MYLVVNIFEHYKIVKLISKSKFKECFFNILLFLNFKCKIHVTNKYYLTIEKKLLSKIPFIRIQIQNSDLYLQNELT